MPLIHTCAIEDSRHGVVIVHTDAERGWVEVAGAGFPAVHLHRSDSGEESRYVPIGTRDPAHLTLTVAGTAAGLTAGRGRFTRSSFRVEAAVHGVRYRLHPSAPESSTLTRDGRKLGELMLGPETTELLAAWTRGADVRPQDAALGYALATAFGTGAESTLMMLVNFVTGSTHA